jgi:poly-D-alanine transfer protein DltD
MVVLIAFAVIAVLIIIFCSSRLRKLSDETRPSHCRTAMESHLLRVKP